MNVTRLSPTCLHDTNVRLTKYFFSVTTTMLSWETVMLMQCYQIWAFHLDSHCVSKDASAYWHLFMLKRKTVPCTNTAVHCKTEPVFAPLPAVCSHQHRQVQHHILQNNCGKNNINRIRGTGFWMACWSIIWLDNNDQHAPLQIIKIQKYKNAKQVFPLQI